MQEIKRHLSYQGQRCVHDDKSPHNVFYTGTCLCIDPKLSEHVSSDECIIAAALLERQQF